MSDLPPKPEKLSSSATEAEKLDQEDQRIKVAELEKLEEPDEESAAIIGGAA